MSARSWMLRSDLTSAHPHRGGYGTLRAANRISEEIAALELKKSVTAIPKTIDNDIPLVQRSFGFDTAVEMATEAIRAAHTEALGARNGVGLEKLMGRYAGFAGHEKKNIAESDFDRPGAGLLSKTAEKPGACRHPWWPRAPARNFLRVQTLPRDASGNLKPGKIGTDPSERIRDHLCSKNMEVNLKYIDPSYMIRSMQRNETDRIYCGFLGQNACRRRHGREDLHAGLPLAWPFRARAHPGHRGE